MKVKTLMYIHQLLVEDEARHETARKMVREAMRKAEEEGAENVVALKDAYDKAYESYRAARGAREDFEAREW